ncbi:MAG: hypothetical protein FRX49_02194 [Trebouxia sp. A1-2]|nr:MAG: hypothetical protein FRX49_02194 [Trebouxia sp. A1-2]
MSSLGSRKFSAVTLAENWLLLLPRFLFSKVRLPPGTLSAGRGMPLELGAKPQARSTSAVFMGRSFTMTSTSTLEAIVDNHICSRRPYVKGQLTLDDCNGGFTATLLWVTIVIHIHHIHAVHLALYYIGVDVTGVHALKVTDGLLHQGFYAQGTVAIVVSLMIKDLQTLSVLAEKQGQVLRELCPSTGEVRLTPQRCKQLVLAVSTAKPVSGMPCAQDNHAYGIKYAWLAAARPADTLSSRGL